MPGPRAATCNNLVVLSHLRWTHVWQRPQHLVSRLAAGRRVWFVEEPLLADVPAPVLRSERDGTVTRVWYEIPQAGRPPGAPEDQEQVSFDDVDAAGYPAALSALLGHRGPALVWLYTPLALPYAAAVERAALVYDVMDDLAAFAKASPAQRVLQQQALASADLVFAGGRSLHAGVRDVAPDRTFLLPSGVEPEHYRPARRLRVPRARPVAGYVGVVDERLDLDLVAELAERLPDWDIELAGPFAKIDPTTAPRAANLRYLGKRPYEELPRVMAGFDVALMPFALNEATRSISPTKTLEYLAAGLPVVSTRVPDVVADFGAVVSLRDDAEGFAAACRALRGAGADRRATQIAPLLRHHHWDSIAERMEAHIAQVLAGQRPAAQSQLATA